MDGATTGAGLGLRFLLGLRLHGGDVTQNPLANTVGQFVLVSSGVNELSLLGVRDETALEKNSRASDGTKNGKSGTLNTTVYRLGGANRAAMNGSGQGNVGAVLIITGK